MAKYYAILTDIGTAAMANAAAMGNKINITQFAVGDGSGTYYQPTSGMTALKNEVWRGTVSEVAQNEDSSNIIDVTGVIPSDAGGFTIREMGVFDASGKLIAVANTPDTAKVVIADGTSSEMSIKMQIAVSNADVINFTLDPTVIIATKRDLEKHTKNYENPHKVTALQVGAINPNLFDDGNFQSWELGTSFTNIATNRYTATMWSVWPDSTHPVVSVSKLNENGGIKLVNGSAVADQTIVGLIEHGTIKPSTTYTASIHGNFGGSVPHFWAADFGKPAFTDGAVKLDDNIYVLTFTTPSVLNNHFFLSASFFDTPANAEVDVHEIKLEEGSQFTGFQHQRLNDVEHRVARYFQRRFQGMTLSYQTSATGILNSPLHTEMRVTPSISIVPGADLTNAIYGTWLPSFTPTNLVGIASAPNSFALRFDNGIQGAALGLTTDVIYADARM